MSKANPLKDQDKEYRETEIPIAPLDGMYTMCIIKFEKGHTPVNDEEGSFPFLNLTMQIIGGEKMYTPCYQKTTFYPNPKPIVKKIRKENLINMGHDGELSDLWNDEERGKFINRCVRVRKSTSQSDGKEYTNYNIKGVVEVANWEEQLAAARSGSSGPSSNIPF